MRAEEELRARRAELAGAVNDHDLEAVRSFIHPSYVGKTRGGQASGYDDIMRLAGQLLGPGSDFQEAVEVEDVAVSGDRARVVVRRSHVMTGWLWVKHRGQTRAVETWWKVDGRWQLVEEQEL
jgi:ketosteroid isomerase-like protein